MPFLVASFIASCACFVLSSYYVCCFNKPSASSSFDLPLPTAYIPPGPAVRSGGAGGPHFQRLYWYPSSTTKRNAFGLLLFAQVMLFASSVCYIVTTSRYLNGGGYSDGIYLNFYVVLLSLLLSLLSLFMDSEERESTLYRIISSASDRDFTDGEIELLSGIKLRSSQYLNGYGTTRPQWHLCYQCYSC